MWKKNIPYWEKKRGKKMEETSPCSRRGTWSLPLITWTKQSLLEENGVQKQKTSLATIISNTSNVVKEWLNRASIKVFELPSQCPDLNPHQDRAGCAEERSPCQEASKCNQIYQVCQEKWLKIQPECYTSIKVKTQCTQYMGGRTGEQKASFI